MARSESSELSRSDGGGVNIIEPIIQIFGPEYCAGYDVYVVPCRRSWLVEMNRLQITLPFTIPIWKRDLAM